MKSPKPEVTTELIWRELSDRLRQFITARIGMVSDVDDILQTVFLRIHKNLNSLHQIDRLESWVFQITRNAIIDHFRKSKKESIGLNVAILEDTVDTEKSENINAEIASCLGSLIEHLPDEQRRAVSMYELEGLSQKEISLRESISLSGAKSRIQRGRKKLETMLRECCKLQADKRGNILECERTKAKACCAKS